MTTCQVTAANQRTASRQCLGTWCGADDVTAWLESSRTMLDYALALSVAFSELPQTEQDVASKQSVLKLLTARQSLAAREAQLAKAWSQYGLLIVGFVDVDALVGDVIREQVAVCQAMGPVIARVPGVPAPPSWEQHKQKLDGWAWSWDGSFPTQGAAAVGLLVVAVVGVAIFASMRGSKGAARRR